MPLKIKNIFGLFGLIFFLSILNFGISRAVCVCRSQCEQCGSCCLSWFFWWCVKSCSCSSNVYKAKGSTDCENMYSETITPCTGNCTCECSQACGAQCDDNSDCGSPYCSGLKHIVPYCNFNSNCTCASQETICSSSGCCNATCNAQTGCGLSPDNSKCQNYCSGNIWYHNGTCSNSCNCTYTQTTCGGCCDCNPSQGCVPNSNKCAYNEICDSSTCTCKCTDECSPSGTVQYRCSGNIRQSRTCGNYDGDSCLEWSSWQNFENCDSKDGCYSGYYRDYYCSGGSCTYTQSCSESCCDQYYSNPYAYCSGGNCYPPPNYTLSISKSGNGSGTVTSNPSGINCGTDCSESYVAGTSVTLTATPASNSYFAGWSGACSGNNNTCTLTMNSDKSVTATFNLQNQPPSVSNLRDTKNSCAWGSTPQAAPGLAITLSWNYSDPDGDSQSAYEIWLDDSSNFSDPKFNHLVSPGSSQSYVLNLSDDDNSDWLSRLSWNKTYYWKVRVRDSYGNWSNWSSSASFTTPLHASPYVNFSFSPQKPSLSEIVQFQDQSQCYNQNDQSISCSQWSWTFQDGNPQSSSLQNPTTTFLSVGQKSVTLRVTDSSNYSCQTTKSLSIVWPLPKWREIPPIIWIRKFLASVSGLVK